MFQGNVYVPQWKDHAVLIVFGQNPKFLKVSKTKTIPKEKPHLNADYVLCILHKMLGNQQ